MAKTRWEGRSRGTPLGYRIFITLLQKGGLRAAYALLGPVGLYYRLFVKSATEPLRYLYGERMGLGPRETRNLIRRNITIFGQTLIDKVAVLAGNHDGLTFDRAGAANLKALVAAGKGGLLVSAHLGNWEVAGHLLDFYGAPINIVMWDGEDEKLKSVLASFNSRRSFNIITVRENGDHIYEISAALTRGELVCIHADRYRPGNRTFSHIFLGKEARFPAGPFLLASKLRAPVSFVFAFKESPTHYRFQTTPAVIYEGHGDSGARAMLNDYVALLEEKLKRYPEQWFNYFNFWADDTNETPTTHH